MKISTLITILYLFISNKIVFTQETITLKTIELQKKVELSSGNDRVKAYQDLLDYVVKNQPLKVFEIGADAMVLAKTLNNNPAEINIILTIGLARAKLHEPLAALKYYNDAYALAIKNKDSSSLCKVLIRMGAAQITKGEIDHSIENFIQAERIANNLGNKHLIIDATNYLGISYYLLDNFNEAISFSERAIKLSTEINYVEGIALGYEHIAIVKIKQEKYKEALLLNAKALSLRQEIDDLQSVSALYYNYSVIYSRLGDFDKAIEYTKKSIELRKSYRNINGVGSNYMTLGNIYLRSNKTDSALVYLKKAYDIKIGTGDNRAITSIVKSLAEVYEKKNDFKNAHKYLREYKTYSDSLFGEDSRRISSKILAQRELVRKEDEIKHLQAINSYQSKIQNFLLIIITLSILLAIAFIVLYVINRKAKNNLFLKNQELTNLNSDKEKFFRIITHDLRSPFHPLIGYTDMIINNVDSLSLDEIKNYTIDINKSAKQIYNLMDNLLHWLSLNTNKMDYKPVKFDLNEELNNTLKLLLNNFKSKGLVLENKISDETFVFADRRMVGIILRNIISNAIKFSKKGGNISLSSFKTNKLIKISIKDGGVGIPANQLSALFTTGMKSTKGTNNESGTGLGLLLCKEMLERNGGSISIESEFEVGTIVSFELPASQ